MSEPMGRRERKKTATRQSIADAALSLFLSRGFDQVSVKDVADAADVATTTLFKYFPTKESLAFDRDARQEARLVNAVRDRASGISIPEALRREFRKMLDEVANQPGIQDYQELIARTPALSDYATRMWLRHETALATTIADELGLGADHPTCRALARFTLDVYSLVQTHPRPEAAIDQIFALIENGWKATRPTLAPRARR